MARFAGVGAANTVVDFMVFGAGIALGLAPVLANIGGFLCGNLQSYLLNARITFRREGRAASISLSGYLKFLVAHAMSLLVSTLVIVALAEAIGPLVAKAAAVGITFLWNYAASVLFVFSKPDSTCGGGSGRD